MLEGGGPIVIFANSKLTQEFLPLAGGKSPIRKKSPKQFTKNLQPLFQFFFDTLQLQNFIFVTLYER